MESLEEKKPREGGQPGERKKTLRERTDEEGTRGNLSIEEGKDLFFCVALQNKYGNPKQG